MTVTFTHGAHSFTMSINDIGETEVAKVKEVPAPGSNPILITLGRTGPEIIAQGLMVGTSNYSNLRSLDLSDELVVSASSYSEFVNSTTWVLTKRKITRKGGYVDQWVVMLTLIKKW